jgi:hypothetical protein
MDAFDRVVIGAVKLRHRFSVTEKEAARNLRLTRPDQRGKIVSFAYLIYQDHMDSIMIQDRTLWLETKVTGKC